MSHQQRPAPLQADTSALRCSSSESFPGSMMGKAGASSSLALRPKNGMGMGQRNECRKKHRKMAQSNQESRQSDGKNNVIAFGIFFQAPTHHQRELGIVTRGGGHTLLCLKDFLRPQHPVGQEVGEVAREPEQQHAPHRAPPQPLFSPVPPCLTQTDTHVHGTPRGI